MIKGYESQLLSSLLNKLCYHSGCLHLQLSLYLFTYLETCGCFAAYCAQLYSLLFFVKSDQEQYHHNEHGKSDFVSYAYLVYY